jgi:predicted phosphoribosyltransferase
MFHNREDAGHALAAQLTTRPLRNPLVLGIPRGGVVIGAVLARDLDAELDVVLSRKLRAPHQPELALGAVSEDGRIHLNEYAQEIEDLPERYLAEERRFQMAEIARRRALFRGVRPQAVVHDRSVIVTDDGIATGSTMIAALHVIREENPCELIVAVPVGAPDRLDEVAQWCDELICLLRPERFWAVGQFYEEFGQIEDEEVVELLRTPHPPNPPLPQGERGEQERLLLPLSPPWERGRGGEGGRR